MKQRYYNVHFCGVEYNNELVEMGNTLLNEHDIKLFEDDLYNLKGKYNNIDGITMYQTLSWLPSYEEAICSMAKLNPQWIALTSLFFDGYIDAEIKLKDYKNNKEFFYNVYPLEKVQECFEQQGYKKFHYSRYDIDIDIEKNSENKGIGTYTEQLQSGRRLQFSGPLWLNWYFIHVEK